MSAFVVEFEGSVVGAAEVEQDDRLGFRYDAGWLERADGFALSVRLPRRALPWSAGEAHPFFANLLPEGIARETICNRLGISPGNDAALLQALGDDTAGAFRLVNAAPNAPTHEPRERLLVAPEDLARWSRGEPALVSNPDFPPSVGCLDPPTSGANTRPPRHRNDLLIRVATPARLSSSSSKVGITHTEGTHLCNIIHQLTMKRSTSKGKSPKLINCPS
ncbi:MAG: HipA N-terminal domain-containing protein, partial [Bradymonadaceae bacterium]|nr:HipA N-terminal domain-containing protein [Lujinxingiaceae bacterium]